MCHVVPRPHKTLTDFQVISNTSSDSNDCRYRKKSCFKINVRENSFFTFIEKSLPKKTCIDGFNFSKIF